MRWEGRPGVADEVRVDAVTDDASDVVGLDDGGE
jgi:hypothetical protein